MILQSICTRSTVGTKLNFGCCALARAIFGFFLLTAVVGNPEAAASPQSVEVPLIWTPPSGDQVEGDGAAQNRGSGRRLAVLLIDRSGSMTFANNPGPTRWDAVLANLASGLQELERVSPGIEVEIRFFDNEVDCVAPMKFVLTGTKAPEVVKTVKDLKAPRTINKPKRGGTALHQAVSVVSGQLSDRFVKGDYEWGFFAVYSDGEDTDSAPEYKQGGSKDWLVAARRLKETLSPSGGQVTVVPVGTEAMKMVADGSFAGFDAANLAASLPKPPPPRCHVALGRAPNFVDVISTGQLLQQNQSVNVAIRTAVTAMGAPCASTDVAAETELVLRVVGDAPFRIDGPMVIPGKGGTVRCVATGKADEGAALRLEVLPRAKAGSAIVVQPTPVLVSATFRPAVAPPDPSLWKLTVPKFVRIGERATLSVDNLDDRFSIEWSLADGARATGPSLSREFTRAGIERGELRATSPDGKQGKREFQVEVIDGAFRIGLPSKSALATPCELEIRDPRTPGSTYVWEIEGKEFSGEKVTFVPTAVGEIPVRCKATTSKGGFVFDQNAVLNVTGLPRLVISEPDSLREGSRSVRVSCVAFDIEGDFNVRLFADGREVGVKKPEPSDVGVRVTFDVPLSQTYWREAGGSLLLKAEVVGRAISDTREIPITSIEGISVQLESPTAGSIIPFGVSSKLVLAVSGPDDSARALVESMRIRVVDARGRPMLVGDEAGEGVERARPDFSVSVQPDPSLHQPPFRIEALLAGSSLKSRNMWLLAGELGAELAKAQFSITTVDGKALEAVAYEPLSVVLNGVPVGERTVVEWTLDGRTVSGDGPAATMPGSEPGTHEVSATVVRADGSREAVGPVTLFCRSSLRLNPASSPIAWESGSPPDFVVELVGAPDELRMVESIQWTGATALPGSALAARAQFGASSTTDGPLQPLQVAAQVAFKGGVKPPEKLVASYTPAPAPVEITRFETSVGGHEKADRSGGVVVVTLETKGVTGETAVVYSYIPTERAKQRGFTAVTEQPLPKAFIIEDEQDGTWTFEARVKSFSGKDNVTKTVAFENERRLNWLAFSLYWAGCWFVLTLLLRLATNNDGLWWGVRFCEEKNIQQTDGAAFTRPFVFRRGRSRRPRWNLIMKRAAAPIDEIEGFSLKPKWLWFAARLTRQEFSSEEPPRAAQLRDPLRKVLIRWSPRQVEPLAKLGDHLGIESTADINSGVRTDWCQPPDGLDSESSPIYFQRKNMRSESTAASLASTLVWLIVLGFPLSVVYAAVYVL
jgi:hypothetical protein